MCLVLCRKEDGFENQPPRKMCYIANLGDTRAVLSRKGNAESLTKDHKASNVEEIERVKLCGGRFARNKLEGMLAVTRALGDF